MKKQIQLFWTAMMFYTRIPVPKNIDHSPGALNKATVYFPIVGWIVGSVSACVFYWSAQVFSVNIAIILYFITSICMTGAFHEDGFADVCDGFGGGWTKEKILTIMKDSAIGAYGAIGLVLLFALKFFTLQALLDQSSRSTVAVIMIAAHSISRGTALSLIHTDKYVSEDKKSKAKPVAEGLPIIALIIALILALIPMLLTTEPVLLLTLLPLLITRQYLSYYFNKWIGGYTGDCLGTVQQVSEVIFYLSTLLIWKFI